MGRAPHPAMFTAPALDSIEAPSQTYVYSPYPYPTRL